MNAPALVLDPAPHAAGAQGAVYLATRADGARLAVKVAADDDVAAAALEWEREVLHALRRAGVGGVVEVLGTATVGGRPALVMPRYDDLGGWFAEVAGRPERAGEVLGRLAELCDVLAGVHRVRLRGGTLVHQDVKPENLLVDASGRLRLADFGGALAIDGLRRVEHVLFGTPMWAPLDQILPARAAPDPTWDTFAVCGMVFALLTGRRPAWQSDPTPLLTPRGKALWDAVAAGDPCAAALRAGTVAEDLLDLTGLPALADGDRRALDAAVGPDLAAALWPILLRGLSPLAHPSPPNRYRDAAELGEALRAARDVAEPPDLLAIDRPLLDEDLPTRSVRAGVAPGLVVGLLVAGLAAVATAAWVVVGLPVAPIAEIAGGRVAVDGRFVDVARFRLDKAEVDHRRWAECAAASACPPRPGALDLPVTASFSDAQSFCRWVGGRLPAEAEWVAAAGRRAWPWGDEAATCGHAVGLGCGDARPVATPTLGATPGGVRDLAGNVAEWTVGEGGVPVLRGGSFRSPASAVGRAGREVVADGAGDDTTGLRCAYDAED